MAQVCCLSLEQVCNLCQKTLIGARFVTRGTSRNTINNISPNNPKRDLFIEKAKKEFGGKLIMVRQRITEGAILEINIENQYYVYAQILTKGHGCAFFDYKTKEKLADVSVLKTASVLFVVAVYNDIITQGHWLKVGKLPIRENLSVLPMQFMQDMHNLGKIRLYNPNTGEITPTTRDKAIGLERAAVWDAHHVEDRIRDYYLGVPNAICERLKLK